MDTGIAQLKCVGMIDNVIGNNTRCYLYRGRDRRRGFPVVGVRLVVLRHLFLEHLLFSGGHLLIRSLHVPLFLFLQPPVCGFADYNGPIPQRDEFRFIDVRPRSRDDAHLLRTSLCELLVEDASVRSVPHHRQKHTLPPEQNLQLLAFKPPDIIFELVFEAVNDGECGLTPRVILHPTLLILLSLRGLRFLLIQLRHYQHPLFRGAGLSATQPQP